jgi:alpha,alpha-trehalase
LHRSRENLEYLESEFNYWFTQHMVTFEHKGEKVTMAHYKCTSDGPRPESYFEDFEVRSVRY